MGAILGSRIQSRAGLSETLRALQHQRAEDMIKEGVTCERITVASGCDLNNQKYTEKGVGCTSEIKPKESWISIPCNSHNLNPERRRHPAER